MQAVLQNMHHTYDSSNSAYVNYFQSNYAQARVLKYMCEASYLTFVRTMFKARDNAPFLLNWHHVVLCHTLEQVLRGKITRLIINIPPRYGKTELGVKMFFAALLVLCPYALNIHLNYSDSLVLDNSQAILDTIRNPLYQLLWPTQLRVDSHAKGKWYTEHKGGMLATTTGGQITGFGAGRLYDSGDTITGAIVIDDPLKPEDAHSVVRREAVNRRYTETISNRVNNSTVPIIVIMQRLHEDDLSGFLLKGGSGEMWHHLDIPANLDDVLPPAKEWIARIPIEYDNPGGSLWSIKHTQEALIKEREANSHYYATQYQQRPSLEGDGVFKSDWWQYYTEYDPIESRVRLESGNWVRLDYKMIFCDTAQKTDNKHDYSVFQCWGKGRDGRIYLLDQVRGKWEAPELEVNARKFFARHEYQRSVNNMGARARYVEDKVSGTGLMQYINKQMGSSTYVKGIQRNTDKVSRAMDGMPHIAKGDVVLPTDKYWIDDYVTEFNRFSKYMTHAHDDQIDPTLDAIDKMLTKQSRGFEGCL